MRETRPHLDGLSEQPEETHDESVVPQWENEYEFSEWFNGVKGDLIEESYEQYQYVNWSSGKGGGSRLICDC